MSDALWTFAGLNGSLLIQLATIKSEARPGIEFLGVMILCRENDAEIVIGLSASREREHNRSKLVDGALSTGLASIAHETIFVLLA